LKLEVLAKDKVTHCVHKPTAKTIDLLFVSYLKCNSNLVCLNNSA